MKTELEIKIIELRELGYSYNKISDILKCSKGTISYYAGKGQKEKTRIRLEKFRNFDRIGIKIERFLRIYEKCTKKEQSKKNYLEILNVKITNFCKDRKTKMKKKLFSTKDLLNKIGENPKCYLTGRPVDIIQHRTYQLDHIVPASKGGENTLENCNIACKEANMAKSNMSHDDFIALCKEVVEHNGYIVTKT